MKKSISFLLLIFCLVLFVAPVNAGQLETLLNPDSLWTLKHDTFQAQGAQLGFRWTSEARDSARSADPSATYLGQRVYETVARFDGDSLKTVNILFYGRGDAGDLGKDAFEELLRKTVSAIDGATGKKFTVRGKDAGSAVKAEGWTWQTEKVFYTLEYSFTKENKAKNQGYRAEFIRLELAQPAERKLVGALPATPKSRMDPRSQVKRDQASGDVWVATVPMVDQGQKGYCAVACAERVLRYFGVDVDANEMAQVANSKTEGGTSAHAMFEALKKLTARLRVRIQAVDEQDVRDLQKLIAEYNRAAKRAKVALLPDPGQMIDVGAMYQAMDTEVLKEVKTKNASNVTRFQREVQTHIDQGTPLLWSVQLGKVPEPGIPQNAGGHMRLIIGYNTKKNEILFSDSWGRGHELKRMPLVDAVTITCGVSVMEPVGA